MLECHKLDYMITKPQLKKDDIVHDSINPGTDLQEQFGDNDLCSARRGQCLGYKVVATKLTR